LVSVVWVVLVALGRGFVCVVAVAEVAFFVEDVAGFWVEDAFAGVALGVVEQG
jgi:hypothetical protein